MRRIKGFTLIESLIALAIFCSLFFVGSLQLESYREKIIFEKSVQEFEMALSQACRRAAINHEQVTVNFHPTDNELRIVGTTYHRSLYFDQAISLSIFNDYQISASGSAPPKTFKISSKEKSKKIKMQMSWGRMIIDD